MEIATLLGGPCVDGDKNPSQQRGALPIPQVLIRLMSIWYGMPDGIMDLLPSKSDLNWLS